MRPLAIALFAAACLAAGHAPAQSVVKVVASAQRVAAGADATIAKTCPSSYYPVGQSLKSQHEGAVTLTSSILVTFDGKPIELNTITDAGPLSGAGWAATVHNTNALAAENVSLMVSCFSPSALGMPVNFIRSFAIVSSGDIGEAGQFCELNWTAVGGVSNAWQPGMRMLGLGPIWGTDDLRTYLADVPVGTTDAPAGWLAAGINTGTGDRTLTLVAICVLVDGASTQVGEAFAQAGQTMLADPGAVADTTQVLGFGFDPYDLYVDTPDFTFNFDAWIADGTTGSGSLYSAAVPFDYESTLGLRHFTLRAQPLPVKARPMRKASARVAYATVVLPSAAPVPAATVANVVEFYNAALDHYFITANPKEASDLDTGVHPGWARTGQGFKVYGAGSSGHAGRHPVCRAYGNPAAGLDSHFYSASIEECYSTLSRFHDAWLLEASEVFEMDLPDPVTGACPAGDVPVYRVWNNRTDSNHRYTTSIAIRDQMVAKGYIAEGYGPDSVTLCALAP